MEIAESLRNKIIRVYGDQGRRRLAEIPRAYEECIKKWNLTNCSIAQELSFNLIALGESPEFGPVVVKIVLTTDQEFFTEMTALSLYQGKRICRCHASDRKLGAMLLERVGEGRELVSLPDDSERLEIAADLIAQLPILLEESHGLPTYGHWIERAFHLVREEKLAGEELLSLMAVAEELFKELEAEERPQMLLHGDLHHWNILQNQGGDWQAIDPKGVIGMKCLEPARFMENQIRLTREAERLGSLDQMITLFSEKLDESKGTITKSLLIDAVLSTCWSHEDRSPSDQLAQAIDMCQLVYTYLQQL